jgi:hypothetical protein
MKIIIKSVFFHFLCIFIFFLIYLNISDNFKNILNNKNTFIDLLLLSTTIQAGVGISNLIPITSYSKLMMIIQQFIKISTNVITFYFLIN